jgi:hypothetical protein
LVRLRVDVMVVGSGIPTLAAKNATQEIPIVGVGMSGDPVGIGLVTSLARPGGNVTGVSTRSGEGFFGKHVQLLKEAVPRISRVGYLRDPRNPASVLLLKESTDRDPGLRPKIPRPRGSRVRRDRWHARHDEQTTRCLADRPRRASLDA